MLGPVKNTQRQTSAVFVATLVGVLIFTVSVHAESNSFSSARSLQQALATPNGASLFQGRAGFGSFLLSSSFFSGRTSGNDPLDVQLAELPAARLEPAFKFDRTAELEGDQRMYAFLIDGSYDFNYDNTDTLSWHPYIAAGAGMAVYGPSTTSSLAYGTQPGDMVPLFRVGGGVTYRLGEQWKLSLDYKAGFSGAAPSGDQYFTGRGQQPVDLQVLTTGVQYKF